MVNLAARRIQSSPPPSTVAFLFGFVVFFLIFSSPVQAEPLAIRTGVITFAWEGPATIVVSGPGFDIPGGDSNPEEFGVPGLAIEHANPLGTQLPLGGRVAPNLSGVLILADRRLEAELIFDLTFHAGSAPSRRTHLPGDPLDPRCPAGCTQISATGPFRLSGELTVVDYISGQQTYHRALTGAGMATVGFREAFGELRPFARYEFDGAAPVPEPGTLLLVGLGGALAVLRKQRGKGFRCPPG